MTSIFSSLPNKGQRQHIELATDLPVSLYAAIGKLAFKHAFIEYQLMQIIYVAAGVNRQLGRVLARQPRLNERLTMVTDLLALKGLSLKESTASFDSELRSLGDDRDKIVHGTWINLHGQPQLVLSRGNWSPTGAGKAKRTIRPQGVSISAKDIEDLAARFDEASLKANEIMKEVLVLLNTSPEKLRPKID